VFLSCAETTLEDAYQPLRAPFVTRWDSLIAVADDRTNTKPSGLDSLVSRLQYSPVHATDNDASTYSHSWNSWCLCPLLEWPTSTSAASSSRAKEAAFYRKPSFNAHQSRVGDLCEVGERIQSVFDTPHSIHLMPSTDSDIVHVNALGTSMIILNSHEVAVNLLHKRSSIYSSR
jgi:hypothetical protein